MADEPTPTPTPQDTPPSPTIDPPTDAPPADAPPADAPPADDDSSVLGGRADDAPPADDAPQGPPETYELALEGLTLDAEAVAAAEPVFRELNLTNDQANKLLPVAKDFAERTAQATLASIVEAGATQRKEWLDAFVADPDIGGARREETEHLAGKALDALGYGKDHAFRKALTDTGFGNHPEMIRVFRKIGEMVGEDGFVTANTGPSAKVDRLASLYPEDVPKT